MLWNTSLQIEIVGRQSVPIYLSALRILFMYTYILLFVSIATAKSMKPCVLFIDELDAVGGKRNSSPMHPYSRMTLNQLLVELDGFNELEGVIVMGATNFPEALDS